jgi:ATP-dependent RNA helicase DHX29
MFEDTETDVQTGVAITVRAMPLPKSFASSSPTPKSSLQTLVVKLDKFSLVDYTPLSGSFRAARVALKIRWGSGRQQEWRMEDVGCWTVAEAENYVATLALHELNAVEGRGERGMWRLLPPVFRDLWDELEEKKKEDTDRDRRGTWAMLRGILEARLAASEELESRVSLVA